MSLQRPGGHYPEALLEHTQSLVRSAGLDRPIAKLIAAATPKVRERDMGILQLPGRHREEREGPARLEVYPQDGGGGGSVDNEWRRVRPADERAAVGAELLLVSRCNSHRAVVHCDTQLPRAGREQARTRVPRVVAIVDPEQLHEVR